MLGSYFKYEETQAILLLIKKSCEENEFQILEKNQMTSELFQNVNSNQKYKDRTPVLLSVGL